MCGIAGIRHHRRAAPVDEAELIALRDAQAHRGPDDAGAWFSPDRRMALGHRRLSIIDLSSAGHQPMGTADGSLQIVFNGEIYNFRALRSELEERGFVFRSQSDTEVLLHGYRAWGVEMFDKLRGMFALALWDEEARELVLARDPLGIKARYLVWGSIPAPRTLHSNIRALPAGHFARVRPGGMDAPVAYYHLEDAFGTSRAMSSTEGRAALLDALQDTARAHLESDVPVGAFLSGGVDSAALVALLTQHDANMRTVTLSVDVASLDEAALARQAAELYGSDHREVPIHVEAIRGRMPDAIRALDQPSVDGVNTYFVAEAAVAAGLKVAVSGVGGDELFGGYTTFQRIPRILELRRRFRGWPAPAVNGLAGLFDRFPAGPVTTRVSKTLRYATDAAGAYFAERSVLSEAEVRRLLAPEVAEAVDGAVDELRARVDLASMPHEERVSALEMAQYMQMQLLRDTDAVSMRHSLEVRTPLVDRELLARACGVPPDIRRSGPAKRLLREAAEPPVPEALWNRPKQGFTLPFDHWLKSGGIELRLPRHDWLRADAMDAMERSFRRGRLHYSRVWQLHVLAEFLD